MAEQNYEVSSSGPDQPYIVVSRDGKYQMFHGVIQTAVNDAVMEARTRKCLVDVFHATQAVYATDMYTVDLFVTQPLYTVVPA